MNLIILVFFAALSLETIKAASFARPISEQWPWSQWTTELPPGQKPSTYPPPSTSRPPPEVTFLPPRPQDERLIIITDPSTGQILYIPAKVFWERFGGGGRVTSTVRPPTRQNTPRNPFVCDFYARNCWLPNSRPGTIAPTPNLTPSRGGGGGSHIYGHPNFHQGAFPGPNEPPRDSGRNRPAISQNTTPNNERNLETESTTFRPFRSRPTTVPVVQVVTATASVAVPSRGGGGGSHIYGHPNFHQGAFPGANEPPRDSGRNRPAISQNTTPNNERNLETESTTFRPFRSRPTTVPVVPVVAATASVAVPSRGGGGGSHIYGHPNFHQGAFPGPNEPSRSAGRTNPRPEKLEKFEASASIINSFVVPSFGITGQTRQFFENQREIENSGQSQSENDSDPDQQQYEPFDFQQQGTKDYRPFPVQPPASNPFFENYDPNNNVFLYTLTRTKNSPTRQRFSGGTGIGGVTCEEGDEGCLRKSNRAPDLQKPQPQFTAPPSLRRIFATTLSPPTTISTTLEPKIRVTRPVSTEKTTPISKITTEYSTDYSADLHKSE